ncbi:hypothetical protein ACFVAV_02420 [Nocardia sp. NPDC057663]|uniref:hypothetical protein n=1 Tax=Nocardia sp. NPDC057663 TaxID=3346201 RepID=UPI00366AA258
MPASADGSELTCPRYLSYPSGTHPVWLWLIKGVVRTTRCAVDLVELRKRPLTPAVLVMLYALQVASRADVVERLFSLVDDVSVMFGGPNGLDDLQAVVTYIGRVSDVEPEKFEPLLDLLEPQVREAIVTTAEILEARGEARGKSEGEVRGKGGMLLQQLGLKFGAVSEAVTVRVRAATLEELDRWALQFVTATTIEEALS